MKLNYSKLKFSVVSLFLIMRINITAQTITPQVINSAGSDRQVGTSGYYLTDNVGEPFTETLLQSGGSQMLTQGFLQPVIGKTYALSIAQSSTTCSDKNDGLISVAFTSNLTPVNVRYKWLPVKYCPSGNCGNTLDSLEAGTYTLQIFRTYTNSIGQVKNDSIPQQIIEIKSSPDPCKITIFTGFTANNDGKNEVWEIGNITEFPKNRVTIYNRWGNLVYDVKGYDNTLKVWPAKSEVDKLTASTYFYVIDLGDGSRLIKGWVELIK